jgi:hypothetical protein
MKAQSQRGEWDYRRERKQDGAGLARRRSAGGRRGRAAIRRRRDYMPLRHFGNRFATYRTGRAHLSATPAAEGEAATAGGRWRGWSSPPVGLWLPGLGGRGWAPITSECRGRTSGGGGPAVVIGCGRGGGSRRTRVVGDIQWAAEEAGEWRRAPRRSRVTVAASGGGESGGGSCRRRAGEWHGGDGGNGFGGWAAVKRTTGKKMFFR